MVMQIRFRAPQYVLEVVPLSWREARNTVLTPKKGYVL